MDGLNVVTIDALPRLGTEAANSYRGACINVYAVEQSEVAALSTTDREVAEAGWVSRSVERVSYVRREDFEAGSDGLAYFEQALIDGVVLVLHAFSNAADDSDVLH